MTLMIYRKSTWEGRLCLKLAMSILPGSLKEGDQGGQQGPQREKEKKGSSCQSSASKKRAGYSSHSLTRTEWRRVLDPQKVRDRDI